MNYNFIHQLLDNGVNEEEIISSLVKSIPHLAKKARKMISGGWSSKDIINEFSKDKEAQRSARNIKPSTPSEISARHLQNSYTNIPKSSSQESKENLTNFTKQVAPYALGALASPFAGTMAEAALSRALPKSQEVLKKVLGPQIANASTSLMRPEDSMQVQGKGLKESQALGSSQSPVNSPNIPQVSNVEQPKENSNISNLLWESLEKGKSKSGDFDTDAFLKIARRMKSTGEISSKEELDKFFQLFSKKKLEGKNLPQALKEASRDYDRNKFFPPEELEQEIREPINKGSFAISPQGSGQIKEVRNGQALIDIDGKLHRVSEDELIESPLPQKDLSDLYSDLIGGIEEETGEDVSRMVNFAGYDPKSNTLAFLPHDGGLYLYPDISEEEKSLLTDILSTRKTSGENFIGAWKSGSKSPIGAALSKLIKDLQLKSGGKGKEYTHKFETVYNFLEPAVKASKKNKKK